MDNFYTDENMKRNNKKIYDRTYLDLLDRCNNDRDRFGELLGFWEEWWDNNTPYEIEKRYDPIGHIQKYTECNLFNSDEALMVLKEMSLSFEKIKSIPKKISRTAEKYEEDIKNAHAYFKEKIAPALKK